MPNRKHKPRILRSNRRQSYGFEPMEISHIRRAYEKGLGNIDDIEIVGSKLDDVKQVFKRSK